MAYPEYDPNEPSLGQTFADLLRGMSKKQSYQELGQGIQNVTKVAPSVVESLGRGALVQLPALAGDTSQLARQFIPETMQNTFGNRTMPTSEEILANIPRINPNYQGSQQHEMVGGLISPAMPSLLRAGAQATKNMPIGNMIAYHGTPHEIKGAFDISKVGTGEGAQAYGHGMYFAESPKVAESYKGRTVFNEPTLDKFTNGPNYYTDSSGKHFKVRDYVKNDKPVEVSSDEYNSKFKEVSKLFNEQNQGNLYKVDIPDEQIPNMLDWDKPLSQQSKSVQNALAKHDSDLYSPKGYDYDPNETGQSIYHRLATINAYGKPDTSNVYKESSNLLNQLGIKGIRYLDEGSRDTGKGTSNFVVFDPKEVKILEKNSKPVTRKEILEEQIKKIE
jgi:hypothetical protein